MIESDNFEHSWVTSPGDTIADILEERGWTAAEFAERMGYTPKHVNELLHGRASITAETALRLEAVLGSTANFWLSRESKFREGLARQQSSSALQESSEWLRILPMKQLIAWGWIPDERNPANRVATCLRFFGVSSVRAWYEVYSKPVERLAVFRASHAHAMKPGAVASWLRKGEIEAMRIKLRPWNKLKFKAALAAIRTLTLKTDPTVFLPILTEYCAEVGVAFVHIRAPEGCPASGATKFLSPDKALLMLSFRHLREDAFWFSFFHEAAHLVLHSKRAFFLDVPDAPGKKEADADCFAEDTLVPEDSRHKLRQLTTPARVLAFARRLGVSPGIIVGQLHHHKLVPYNRFSHMITRYRWKE